MSQIRYLGKFVKVTLTRMKLARVVILVAALFIIIGYQNCAQRSSLSGSLLSTSTATGMPAVIVPSLKFAEISTYTATANPIGENFFYYSNTIFSVLKNGVLTFDFNQPNNKNGLAALDLSTYTYAAVAPTANLASLSLFASSPSAISPTCDNSASEITLNAVVDATDVSNPNLGTQTTSTQCAGGGGLGESLINITEVNWIATGNYNFANGIVGNQSISIDCAVPKQVYYAACGSLTLSGYVAYAAFAINNGTSLAVHWFKPASGAELSNASVLNIYTMQSPSKPQLASSYSLPVSQLNSTAFANRWSRPAGNDSILYYFDTSSIYAFFVGNAAAPVLLDTQTFASAFSNFSVTDYNFVLLSGPTFTMIKLQ